MLVDLHLSLTPVPASRPRVTRWGVHYGKRYKEWRAAAEKLLEHLEEPLVVSSCRAQCLFAIPRSRTGKLLTPIGDGDNYEKAIFDLLQRRNWLADDLLIVSAAWDKRFLGAGSQGYTLIQLYEFTKEIEI